MLEQELPQRGHVHQPDAGPGSVPPDEKLKLGITETFIRFSVGIENFEDLKEEIVQALA